MSEAGRHGGKRGGSEAIGAVSLAASRPGLRPARSPERKYYGARFSDSPSIRQGRLDAGRNRSCLAGVARSARSSQSVTRLSTTSTVFSVGTPFARRACVLRSLSVTISGGSLLKTRGSGSTVNFAPKRCRRRSASPPIGPYRPAVAPLGLLFGNVDSAPLS